MAAPRARLDSVTDRVLHQGLEDQARHHRVERLGVGLDPDGEPVAEPGVLDVGVLLDELELLAERHLLGAVGLEAHPEQVAQAGDDPVGRLGVGPHQRGDRVQGVEEEVRAGAAS